MLKEYVVVFTGVEVDIPVEERTFRTKHEAKVFKHEHPHGKFAAVIKTSGTFSE
jgi:hypothetical protein